MPRFRIVAWAQNGKRASSKTYSTVVGFRDGLRAISDSRYYTVHIEVLRDFWDQAIYGIVQSFTDGDYAPTTGPCKRRWDYLTDPDGSCWRLNDIGDVTLSQEGGVAGAQFEPQWIEWTPPPNQAA